MSTLHLVYMGQTVMMLTLHLVLYPDPEQGTGDTQYNSIILTAENVVAN